MDNCIFCLGSKRIERFDGDRIVDESCSCVSYSVTYDKKKRMLAINAAISALYSDNRGESNESKRR
jgi:hypothetical protein